MGEIAQGVPETRTVPTTEASETLSPQVLLVQFSLYMHKGDQFSQMIHLLIHSFINRIIYMAESV